MFAKKPHILVVDDDPEIGNLVANYLDTHGFRVTIAKDGRQMQSVLKKELFDALVLDVMLPGDDGLTLCRKLRQTSDIPVLLLSAMGEDTDRIVGLEVGADDYLPKPFNPRELLARLKALLRRAQGLTAQGKLRLTRLPHWQFANWVLDRNQRVLIDSENLLVPLSAGEYALLDMFLQNPQRVLTRDQLLNALHGREGQAYDRTIDVQVGRLRKKIEKDAKNPLIIITVRGGGYQLDVPVTECLPENPS